ncbi:Protein SENSITIVITY TO RED LIGHT REDUCED like [Actinidia chinensis var. chinensis]|uniref:Protein SENSITIVITY TO RED LIGHT REDUCED like n=1 Tax=Actinidia chinensis var. chinensis TaxID=1590841 RepID=A0A2R6R9T6_ACTCC|nr:Protein SENSITIVITY TO RED LIGHT REDUCED like [Actinidia chinensis var. chinensis]
MAASAKTLTLEKPNLTGDWTIVLPRRRKQRRNFLKSRTAEQEQPWVPIDHEIDLDRESKLMQKMQICMKKVESSEFFCTFIDQIQTPQILDCIFRVLGSEPKMQMVIYGIGSIESYETPRLQLALAILMKKRLSWIGDMEVFDPILSATETRVLETLGCSVLSVNEQGRRQALKPTLFFMPHCEAELYDNLLQANWRVDMLKRVVLFGNSFETYEQYVSVFKNSTVVNLRKHILAVRRFTKEFGIKTVSDDYFRAFHDLSWHFFSFNPEMELQFGKLMEFVDTSSATA